MRTKAVILSLALLLLVQLLLPAGASAGRPGRWELLGQRSVTDGADHDVIPVTAAQGTFRALRIRVEDRPVQFRDVKVHFAHGETQDVPIRNVIPAGGESRIIDIRGRGDRVVRSVELWYDAQSLAGKRATVKLYGKN
jgi:hypothetical protein